MQRGTAQGCDIAHLLARLQKYPAFIGSTNPKRDYIFSRNARRSFQLRGFQPVIYTSSVCGLATRILPWLQTDSVTSLELERDGGRKAPWRCNLALDISARQHGHASVPRLCGHVAKISPAACDSCRESKP